MMAVVLTGLPATARANPPAPVRPPGPPPPPSPLAPTGEAAAMAERPFGQATYRPGGGLTLKSQDDRFAISVSSWAQLLFTAKHDPLPPTGTEPTTASLKLRRARLVMQGHVFSPNVKYYAHLMFSPKDLAFKDGVPHRGPMFQWYMSFTRLRHANVQAGFFFVPYARQRMQPLPRLQFADNSTASYEFTLDQDIGIQVSSPDIAGLGLMRYYAGVFMGEGYDWYRPSDFGLTYMGRFEVLPLGMFEDFSEADFERGLRPRLSLGAAYAYSDRDHRTRAIAGTGFADGGTMRSHNLTADLMFKWAGLSVLGDVYCVGPRGSPAGSRRRGRTDRGAGGPQRPGMDRADGPVRAAYARRGRRAVGGRAAATIDSPGRPAWRASTRSAAGSTIIFIATP